MENVASVGFTSCALRHNAKLPLLDVPAGPVAASPGQQPQSERPLSRGEVLIRCCLVSGLLFCDFRVCERQYMANSMCRCSSRPPYLINSNDKNDHDSVDVAADTANSTPL